MRNNKLVGSVVAISVAAVASVSVATVVDPYSSTAGGGNFGVDGFVNDWSWQYAGGNGDSVWGSPGLGTGVATYLSPITSTSFTVTFTLPDPSPTIDTTPPPSVFAYSEGSQFYSGVATTVYWTPTYSSDSVTFTAPSGVGLTSGDAYFVAVAFTGNTLSGANTGFSAAFDSAVPEPTTWAMMLVGMGGLGLSMRARRRGAVAA